MKLKFINYLFTISLSLLIKISLANSCDSSIISEPKLSAILYPIPAAAIYPTNGMYFNTPFDPIFTDNLFNNNMIPSFATNLAAY